MNTFSFSIAVFTPLQIRMQTALRRIVDRYEWEMPTVSLSWQNKSDKLQGFGDRVPDDPIGLKANGFISLQ